MHRFVSVLCCLLVAFQLIEVSTAARQSSAAAPPVQTSVAACKQPCLEDGGANPSVFLTSGESSFGDLYFEGHSVGAAGVRDDELILPVLRRRDLNRTLRSG
jgi:hypothetical protein